ncbi:MAG: MFS transporter [Thermoplasmata archaeon]
MAGSITESIDNMEYSSFHRKVFLLSSAGVFLDGYDLFIISIVLLYITPWINKYPPNLQGFVTGLLGSAALIGMFFGALIFGHFTDKMGRRSMYIIDLVFFVLFAILSALAQNLIQLIIFRFFLGFGIGADYPISSTYVTEFSPKNVRGKLISKTFMFWGIGAFSASIIGYIIAYFSPWGADSWRLILLTGVVPALIVIFLRSFMPESPRWLISKGRGQDAINVLKKLKFQTDENMNVTPGDEVFSFKDMLSPLFIRRTLFSWIPWFFMDIGVYGINIFQPTILQELGFKGLNSILGSSISYFFGIIGFILAIMFIDRIGRLKLQIIGFSGMIVFLILISLLVKVNLILTLLFFALFEVFQNAGPNTTTWLVPLELFPTRLRATAQGSSTAISRLGAISGVLTLPILKSCLGIYYTIMIISSLLLLGLIFTILFGEETKNLTLEESSSVFKEFSKPIYTMIDNLNSASRLLYELVVDPEKNSVNIKKIKELEHINDTISGEVYKKLNRRVRMPIERNDIFYLVSSLDDIMDAIEGTSKKIYIYGIDKNNPNIVALAEINNKSINEITNAVKNVFKIKLGEYEEILNICDEVHRLENITDDIVDAYLKELIKETDIKKFLTIKEIAENMEKITDRCDDVGDIIKEMVVRYS